MAPPRSMKPKSHDSSARRRWLLVGLAAFLVFDVALVAFALKGPAAESASTAPVPRAVVEPVETPTPTPTPTASTPPAAPAETPPPTRLIAALNSSTAWRATTGPCPTAQAIPELTTDAGSTWTESNASKYTASSSILAVNAISKSEASMVTLAAADCTPQLDATFVAGAEWKDYPDRLGGNWFVVPAARAHVHSPAGDVKAPCPAVITLAAQDAAHAAVLCSDASVAVTSDGGASWSPPAPITGAVAIAATKSGYLAAVRNPAGCAGVALADISERGKPATAVKACLPTAVKPGRTALTAADDGTIWIWAGDALTRSSDGGATWG